MGLSARTAISSNLDQWQEVEEQVSRRELGILLISPERLNAQDDLPGPDGDEPYVLFVNQTEYGNARYRYAGLRLPADRGVPMVPGLG